MFFTPGSSGQKGIILSGLVSLSVCHTFAVHPSVHPMDTHVLLNKILDKLTCDCGTTFV